MLVHSSRTADWDGLTGNKSIATYYSTSTSDDVEYTSGTPYDIYSKLRREYDGWTNLLIQWTTATDMTGATNSTRPVFEFTTSQTANGLTGLATNLTLDRKSGNTGELPTSGYGLLGTRNGAKLYYKKSQSGSTEDRTYIFSSCLTDNQNQDGFYGWDLGQYAHGGWVSDNSTVKTVAFYIK